MKIVPKLKPCKDCNTEVQYPKQLCEPCREVKLHQRKIDYRAKHRKKRYCNGCQKEIKNPKSNSERYCSDDCRPKKQVTAKKLREAYKMQPKKRGKSKKLSGIDSKWTNPRGSKQRTKLGLEEVIYSSNHVGGYSEV